ncbi:unnamed protein product, partial [Ectocarpus sp. 12 AP-2014]
ITLPSVLAPRVIEGHWVEVCCCEHGILLTEKEPEVVATIGGFSGIRTESGRQSRRQVVLHDRGTATRRLPRVLAAAAAPRETNQCPTTICTMLLFGATPSSQKPCLR